MNSKTIMALAGLLVLGLSPSFVDWKESDGREKTQIVLYYAGALTLVYFGVLKN